MSSSTLKVYASTDASAPSLTGAVGSLLALLDAVLVNGYGSQTAAGWTKPIANAGNIGCYKQGAGAGFNLVVNDNGPNGTSTYKEAWAIGWETLAGIGSPVGSGTGQCPTPAQLLTSGHMVCRKSTTADSTARFWICFADASTFYLFILTGDTAGVYYGLWFGDFFSLGGSTDAYRAFILGSYTENATGNNQWDVMLYGLGAAKTVLSGRYIFRAWTGLGSSIPLYNTGDISVSALASDPPIIDGNVIYPNPTDNTAQLYPMRIADSNNPVLFRGRFRGIYQVCHSVSSFSDGQIIQGANDYSGKQFQIVRKGPNGGFIAVETSTGTVETN